MDALAVVQVILIIGIYSLPSIIAMSRKVPHARSVILTNVFLGWTFMGWVAALRMACRSKTRPVRIESYSPRDG
jgi:T4 superinfection immunity protein